MTEYDALCETISDIIHGTCIVPKQRIFEMNPETRKAVSYVSKLKHDYDEQGLELSRLKRDARLLATLTREAAIDMAKVNRDES